MAWQEKKNLTITFDGGCYPNPGGDPTYGYIITADNGVLFSDSGKVENPIAKTNNVAEYCAIINALQKLKDAGWHGTLHVRGDSKLVVEQIKGTFACTKEHLKKLRSKASNLIEEVSSCFTIEWIKREENKICDYLAKTARNS